jgi:hypothetical protein
LLKMIFNIAVGEDNDGNEADESPKISAAQVKELSDLADEVGADKAKFCQYLKVDALASITEKGFPRAKQALEAKRKKAS